MNFKTEGGDKWVLKRGCRNNRVSKIMLDNERKYNMQEKSEEKYVKAKIIIEIDEEGHIVFAKDEKGKEIKYHPEEKKRIHDSQTRLLTPNDCCWRKTALGLRCRPEYCT